MSCPHRMAKQTKAGLQVRHKQPSRRRKRQRHRFTLKSSSPQRKYKYLPSCTQEIKGSLLRLDRGLRWYHRIIRARVNLKAKAISMKRSRKRKDQCIHQERTKTARSPRHRKPCGCKLLERRKLCSPLSGRGEQAPPQIVPPMKQRKANTHLH